MGACVAGMLIAETDDKHRIENDIRPFHDVLLGLFFITIGMKLDWQVLYQQWTWVLVLTIAPIAIKALLVAFLAHRFGAPTGVAARTGIYLAQAGEFGFVLLTLGLSNGLIDPLWSNPVLAAMVLSMVATPFLIQYADRVVYRFAADDWLSQSLNITSLAQHTITIDHHVIICGFGRTGKNLCNLLESEKIGYLALDLHPDVVHAAMLAETKVRHYPLVETFDAWESWDVIHTAPDRLSPDANATANSKEKPCPTPPNPRLNSSSTSAAPTPISATR
jgi:CPA2 family monovalent cation:H+ antiporter-2